MSSGIRPRRSKSSVSTLSVVEPATPMARGANDDDDDDHDVLQTPRAPSTTAWGMCPAFDFDALDRLLGGPCAEVEEEHEEGEQQNSGADAGYGFGFDFDFMDAVEEAAAAAAAVAPTPDAFPPAPPFKVMSLVRAATWSLISGGSKEEGEDEDEDEVGLELPGMVPLVRSNTMPAKITAGVSRIAMLSNGSRGDVQPLVALSLRLHRLGHEVRLLTNADLVPFCMQRGVDAVPVFAACQAVIESIGGMGGRMAENLPSCMLRGKKAAEDWLKQNPGVCTAGKDALDVFKPDLVICGSQATGLAMRYEAATGVPVVYTFFSRMSLDFAGGITELCPERPSLFAVSPVLGDLGKRSDLLLQTGDWSLPEFPTEGDFAGSAELSALRDFLARGSAPVVIGWGSMIAEGFPPVQKLGLALRALRASGRRGVVVGGWSRLHQLGNELFGKGKLPGLGPDAAELAAFAAKRVCFVAEAPHAWLLPQCCGAVHHGGAGTTQAALRAGIPSVITPIFWDQFGHGTEVQRLGAGVAFKEALPQISAAALATAIRRAVARAPVATQLGARLRDEDGVQSASLAIDGFLRKWVRTGRFARDLAKHREALDARHKKIQRVASSARLGGA